MPSNFVPLARRLGAAAAIVLAAGAAPALAQAVTPAATESAFGEPSALLVPEDTVVRRRPKAIEVSDAYEIRLRIHRYAAYTVIPLFAVQSIAGNQLYQADANGAPRPGWAKTTHSLGAAALGTVFTVNTVTGLWNLWDSRDNEVGRTKRILHSVLLLGSDAGFTWSGIKLASDAKNSQQGRNDHRRVAYISMGAALAGYGIMLFGNH